MQRAGETGKPVSCKQRQHGAIWAIRNQAERNQAERNQIDMTVIMQEKRLKQEMIVLQEGIQ